MATITKTRSKLRIVLGWDDASAEVDLHILTPDGELGLIDFADLRIHPWGLGRYLRARNMRRMQGMADECDWVDIDAIVNARPPRTEQA